MRQPKKWFPYTGSVILLALGLCLLCLPDLLINLFPPLLGTIMIFAGGANIAGSFLIRDKLAEPGIKLIQGFVNIIVGAVFLLKRDLSMAFLAILFGLYVLVSSGISLSEALQKWPDKRGTAGGVVEGLVGLVMGALLLFAPFTQRSVWSRVLGLYFIGAAANAFYWTWRVLHTKPAEKEEEKPEENV